MMLQSSPDIAAASTDRQLPHSIDAEQALLGAILNINEVVERFGDTLAPAHFYDPLHGAIYEAVAKLIQSGKRADPVTLRPFFESAPPVSDDMTVPQYLGRLAASATTTMNAPAYASMIRDLAMRRALIQVGDEMVAAAYESHIDLPPAEIIEEAEAALYRVAEVKGSAERLVPIKDAAARAVDSANAAYRRKGSGGLMTGLIDLDRKLGGMRASDLIILAGRPSMGKTALAMNVAMNIARRGRDEVLDTGEIKNTPVPVLFFSLEMSAEQLADRAIADVGDVSGYKVRSGMGSEDDIARYMRAADRVADLPIHIEETGGISISALAAKARRAKRRSGIGLIVVDYLQLMRGSDKRGQNRVGEITEITTGLKALAKELAVPVLALSQLSRALEARDNKRPQLSDLRESGSIEQDADVVMFVYREEYYVERAKPDPSDLDAYSDWEARMRAVAGKAEVVIGKQRHGPLGTVELAFDGQFTRFSNLAREGQAS